jgi:hypothetical protein
LKLVRQWDVRLPVQSPPVAAHRMPRMSDSARWMIADEAVRPAVVRLGQALQGELLPALPSARIVLCPGALQRALEPARVLPVVRVPQAQSLLSAERQAQVVELRMALRALSQQRLAQSRAGRLPAALREPQRAWLARPASLRLSPSMLSRPPLAPRRSQAQESACAQAQRASCRWNSNASFFL